MSNRGFTLIELVAVVVVLVAIFLLSFPSVLNMVKKDNEIQYNNMIEDLCLAGKTYIYNNMESFQELTIVDSIINIEVSELISYGNVDKNTINIKTNNSVEFDTLTYKVLPDYSLECTYNEE